MFSVDSSCFNEFCSSVVRGVSHLYWRRVYFRGDEEVVVCWRFVLDCGINDVLVLKGDHPSATLSDTSSRMCPLSVFSLVFTSGLPSLFLICLSCP